MFPFQCFLKLYALIVLQYICTVKMTDKVRVQLQLNRGGSHLTFHDQ